MVSAQRSAKRSIRRPLIAVLVMLVLVIAQLIADPTGLLALVGWPGGMPQAQLWWPIARYVVFVPVLLAAIWFAAARVGDRFWVMWLAGIWAVTLAQFATLFAMTLDLPLSAWGSGYVLAKAVPAAFLVALITRIFGGRADYEAREAWFDSPAATGELIVWPGLFTVAALAVLPWGYWWAVPVSAETLPVPLIGRSLLPLLFALLLWFACTWLGVQLLRRKVPCGLLGPWLGYVVGGAIFGVLISLLAIIIDGIGLDMWALTSGYMRIADGVSLGATTGGIGALITFALIRLRAALGRAGRPTFAVLGGVLAAALAATIFVVQPLPPRATAVAPEGFLRVEDGHFADGNGNRVLLRGVNVNNLVDFYQYDPEKPVASPFTKEDVQAIASYGFNVIRLGLSWSAIEPKRGSYDEEYLAQVDEIVAWGEEAGVRIVLDMHQDGWYNGASDDDTSCRPGTDPMWGFDGAPEWATITDGAPRCQFTGRDISPAGDRAFEHFFFNTDGVRDALAATWGTLAARYKDKPNVAGFDLLNEPGFGETAPATTALKVGEFYADAISEIRDAGAPQIVFVEPSILWSGLGFEAGPRPDFTGDANIAFSPHLYAESITMDRDLGITPIVSIERQFGLAQRTADAYDAALWSGEYGYWGDDSVKRLKRYAAAEDARGLGSAYWVWKQACGDPQNGVQATGDGLIPQDCGTNEWLEPRLDLLEILSRPYPRVVPGELRSLRVIDGVLEFEGDAGDLDSSGDSGDSGDSGPESCDLQVWFPGEKQPELEAASIEQIKLDKVAGGWLIGGCVTDEYALNAWV